MIDVTAGGVNWTVDRHGPDRHGRPVLLVADGSPLTVMLAAAAEPVPAVIEGAQLSAHRGPDRVRARIELLGWLEMVPPTGHRAAMATLSHALPTALSRLTGGTSLLRAEIFAVAVDGVGVNPDDYSRARPDPFVDHEWRLLRELLLDRRRELARLCACLDPALAAAAWDIVPAGLDRHGITVRVTRLDGVVDVRLAFRAPVTAADELKAAVQELLGADRRGGDRANRSPFLL